MPLPPKKPDAFFNRHPVLFWTIVVVALAAWGIGMSSSPDATPTESRQYDEEPFPEEAPGPHGLEP